MKAAVYTKYGAPSVLKIKEVETPIPKNNEVLVKIMASSINSADVEMLKGTFLGRLSGLFKPAFEILGSDISGVVEAVGSEVTLFEVGDEVYGDMTGSGFATFAEYKAVDEKKLSRKPDSLTFLEAATIPSAGVIAFQSINNIKSIKPGQQVLINGAGGGMGTMAVQMAKAFGAYVTGVDKSVKLATLKSLGADRVMDYEMENYVKLDTTYDRIVDCQALFGPIKYIRRLNADGIFYMIGGSVSSLLRVGIFGSILSIMSTKKVGLLLGKPNNKDDIREIEGLMQQRTLNPVIDKCFKLDDIVEAFEYFETGNFVGKIVIDMADNK
ncbi:MAG: NAD(P)-dependent alcohol dehydrogenase [Clostridiales bacterium]|nr:NAD(P)-dependent alcohol dehydrogenase [Clostridiales bacterium]